MTQENTKTKSIQDSDKEFLEIKIRELWNESDQYKMDSQNLRYRKKVRRKAYDAFLWARFEYHSYSVRLAELNGDIDAQNNHNDLVDGYNELRNIEADNR